MCTFQVGGGARHEASTDSWGSLAGTSRGRVFLPHQELEGQRLKAHQLLAQGANFLAEVQKEQEKRLLEMKQEVASMPAEQEKV